MSAKLSRRTPAYPGDDEAAFGGVSAMFAMVQRSNHATAFAGWIIATGAMGLVVQIGTIESASRSPYGGLLVAALVPVLAAGSLVVALLVRANHITRIAQGDFYRFIAEIPGDAPELCAPAVLQLQWLTAATRYRETLTQQALTWAYITGTALLAWNVTAAVMASGS
ncbi:hypothetical protein [Actinomadura sp. DC4]|uniref:hypothetical protein n=1 Tax=Actinomadura sp. DC4 TaxID=3055069 RepID=UPI0025B1ED93|nr:hypothetical protein [Actinomadura sp. DC4]MDN3355202.1 hypothetical protein [Actinomadura sp. DC4]